MKKLFLTLAICILMCALFVVGASAASVTDDGSNVTLGDCTIANLDGVTIPSVTRGLVYSLDDETMTATVSGRGSFTGGTGVSLVFPSSVTYDEKTYKVTQINAKLFQSLTYDLYIPDSVITLAGGSGSGTFGNSTIDKAYIGSGVKTIGEETFSGSKGYSVFVCKAKPEYINKHAFNAMQNVACTEIVEFDFSEVKRVEEVAFNGCKLRVIANFSDKLEFIGEKGFASSNVVEAYIPAGATVSTSSFNTAQALTLMIFEVAEGETKLFPEQFLSAAGALNNFSLVITGKITFTGNAPFPGRSGQKLYLPDIEALEVMLENYDENVKKDGNQGRIESFTVYVCETGKTYKAHPDGTYEETGTATENHIYSEVAHYEADCSNFERDEKYCYSCNHKVKSNEGTVLGNHIFETYTKLPSCQSIGYTEFDCTVCDLQEVGAFVDKTAHLNTVEKYGAVNGSNLEVSYYCEYCNTLDRTENVSLVNKCYIEGYGLFDATATLDYISVDASGNVTPSGATFERANLYFPSFVKVGEDIVEVKTIQGFNGKSIRAIYVPDTVTRIVGGSGIGCFGNNTALLIVVVGKGVTVVEQEIFSMGNGATLNEFVWKGTITEIHQLAFQKVSASSSAIPYEFKTNLTYVGKQVNLNGNIIREARIAKGCDLHEKFAFNNANGLVTIYIEGGDTPETALDLGQEFTSNTGTKYWYIKGYVVTSGWAVLSGQNNSRVFMESEEAIDVFVNTIVGKGNERLSPTTFLSCDNKKAWYYTSSTDASTRTEHPSVAFFHGGVIAETEATCTQGATITETCFVCGETVSQTAGEPLEHVLDGGVITVTPNCKVLGTIVYSCIYCGEEEEKSIFHDYSTHEYSYFIAYINGFDKNGAEGEKCAICDGTRNEATLDAIIVPLGYSVKNNRTGINGGYQINKELLAKYEDTNGKVRIGIIVANSALAQSLGLVDSEFMLVTDKGIQVELNERGYTLFSLSITGFNTDALKALNLLITSYVVADLDGDGSTEISYCQHTMTGDNAPASFDGKLLNTVSIDRADPVAVVPASYKPEEE